jgi:hypothetical protein
LRAVGDALGFAAWLALSKGFIHELRETTSGVNESFFAANSHGSNMIGELIAIDAEPQCRIQRGGGVRACGQAGVCANAARAGTIGAG